MNKENKQRCIHDYIYNYEHLVKKVIVFMTLNSCSNMFLKKIRLHQSISKATRNEILCEVIERGLSGIYGDNRFMTKSEAW